MAKVKRKEAWNAYAGSRALGTMTTTADRGRIYVYGARESISDIPLKVDRPSGGDLLARLTPAQAVEFALDLLAHARSIGEASSDRHLAVRFEKKGGK